MEGVKVFNDSNNLLLHHHNHNHENDQRLNCSSSTTSSSEVLDSLFISSNSSPSFHGSAPLVKFEEKTKGKPFFSRSDKEENGDEDYDVCFHQPEKKRRLLPGQVRFLERSFEVENKLEPERKVQLAKEIGLQPRQVAIWFQNRRARYKTKQLEKDYDSLKSSYDKLKVDYDTVLKENEKLKDEVQMMKDKLVKKEQCDQIRPKPQNVSSSTKSDVVDSDSPHYTHSSLLDPADDSSNMFETDPSEFSQEEDDSLSKRLLRAASFPKLEVECFNDLQANPCVFGLAVEDHENWFWGY